MVNTYTRTKNHWHRSVTHIRGPTSLQSRTGDSGACLRVDLNIKLLGKGLVFVLGLHRPAGLHLSRRQYLSFLVQHALATSATRLQQLNHLSRFADYFAFQPDATLRRTLHRHASWGARRYIHVRGGT